MNRYCCYCGKQFIARDTKTYYCSEECRNSNLSERRLDTNRIAKEKRKKEFLERREEVIRIKEEIIKNRFGICNWCAKKYRKIEGRTKYCCFKCFAHATNARKDSKKLDKKYGEFRECSKLCAIIENKEYENEKVNGE